MKSLPTLHSPGWLVVAGCTLAAFALARVPQQGSDPATGTQSFPLTAASATADSNNRMIAVTGVDITGSSILYLVDTVNYRLAVYQASGGTATMQGLKLVGARRIDLDLELDGFNDKSDYSYKELREKFAAEGLLPPQAEAPPAGAKGD